MNLFFSAPFFLAGGIIAGIGSAFLATQTLGTTAAVKDSPWELRDNSPASTVHPYTTAHYLLDGRLPPSAGQFLELTAEYDAGGKHINASCDYLLMLPAGKTPRWWSVAAFAGRLTADGSTLMNQSAVAEADGSIRIAVTRHPQPGNWIKAPATGRYTLLYMSSESQTGSSGRPVTPALFTIETSGC